MRAAVSRSSASGLRVRPALHVEEHAKGSSQTEAACVPAAELEVLRLESGKRLAAIDECY
jgi:hypothetical protein